MTESGMLEETDSIKLMSDTHKAANAPLVGVFINAVRQQSKITGGIMGISGALVTAGIESCADIVSSLVI